MHRPDERRRCSRSYRAAPSQRMHLQRAHHAADHDYRAIGDRSRHVQPERRPAVDAGAEQRPHLDQWAGSSSPRASSPSHALRRGHAGDDGQNVLVNRYLVDELTRLGVPPTHVAVLPGNVATVPTSAATESAAMRSRGIDHVLLALDQAVNRGCSSSRQSATAGVPAISSASSPVAPTTSWGHNSRELRRRDWDCPHAGHLEHTAAPGSRRP